MGNVLLADFLTCNAGVKIYYSNHSASMQQSNGTRANFEYFSTFNSKSGTALIGYRGTDVPGVLVMPKKIQGTIKVGLELDGQQVQFACYK